jgi:hypothetical protein
MEVREKSLSGSEAASFTFGSARESNGAHPWALSEHGLAWYGAGPIGTDRVTVVVGDGPWDFALFYALRRWTSLAFWYPSALKRSGRLSFLWLSAVARYARTTRSPVAVVTGSGAVARRDRLARELDAQTTFPMRAEPLDWHDVLPDEPNRLLQRGNPGRPEHVPLVGQVTSPLPTPTPSPSAVSCRDPGDMRWMTDAVVDGWTPLRNRRLGPVVIQQPGYGTELARTTRTGAAYFCPHFFWQRGMTLEAVTVRPRLFPMTLKDQLSFLLGKVGWATEFSDKGAYAEETTRLFGGRDALVRALRTKDTARLLNAFRKGSTGIKLGDRRYLSVHHMQTQLFDGDTKRTQTPRHQLMDTRVMLRGLVLTCERCRHTTWYPLDDVGGTFRCERCRHRQEADQLTRGRRSWRGEIEPVWYYRPDEVVQRFLTHNGDLPLLAVEETFESTSRPVDKTFELGLRQSTGRRNFEIDLAVSEGYRLWLGEASTSGTFEPETRLENLRWLTDELDAFGVLIATSKASFPTASQDAVARAFRSSRAQVKWVSGVGRRDPAA